MSQAASAQTGSVRPSLNEAGRRRIVQVVFWLLFIGGILFASAGRLDWWSAWVYLGVSALNFLLNSILLLRSNPDVINERGRPGPNVKGWDKTLTAILSVFGIAMYAVAGLDERFGWSAVSLAWQIAGLVLFVFSVLVTSWVILTNPFLSTRVRIQEERGHQVITAGPYRFVRHPMYAMSVLNFVGVPLLFGSWWAFALNAVCIVLLVVRTAMEDRTLQAELPGYKDYAARTRYRLLPGVW